MLKYYDISKDNIEEIKSLTDNCWINIYPPFDYNAIKELSEKLEIYIEFFTDALDIDEQSRYEQDENVKFILINTPIRNEQLVSSTGASFVTIPISIVLKDKIIITTSLFKNPVIDSIINQSRNIFYNNTTSLILNIFNQNINYFLYYLKQINVRLNDFEKSINQFANNKDFIQILHLQKSLIFFETNLRTNNLMLIKMKRTNFLFTKENESYDDFFDEIIIENRQAIEMTEVYSRILNSSMQTINSLISNNVNTVMKRFTAATILLMIPSIISSFMGMNLILPFSKNIYGFYIMVAVSLIIMISTTYLFIKRFL